jgi:hypothetical protein
LIGITAIPLTHFDSRVSGCDVNAIIRLRVRQEFINLL